MTTTAKHLLSEIVAGLDGVSEGPWYQDRVRVHSDDNDDCIAEVFDGPCYANAAHIARLSPDRIRAIAAYVEQLEKENRVLHELRRDLITLQKRIIGETGLSAIETIDRALKIFEAAHLYEIFDEDRAALGGSNE